MSLFVMAVGQELVGAVIAVFVDVMLADRCGAEIDDGFVVVVAVAVEVVAVAAMDGD